MKFIYSVLLSGLIIGLSACTASNSLSTQMQDNGSMLVQRRVNNPVLMTEIGIDQVHMVNVGDLKKVALGIKNQRFNNKHFFYKIVWKNAQGIEIDPEGAIWKPIELTGREIKGVQSLAPNPSAVNIVIYFKK